MTATAEKKYKVPAASGVLEPAWSSWAPPYRGSVVDWAESHLELDAKWHQMPGPLRIRDVTPYMVEPLEKAADPRVREMTWMFGAQLSKSMGFHVLLAFWAATDPGPMLFALNSEVNAIKIAAERIKPLFESSPKLRHLVPANSENWTQKKLDFGRCVCDMAWAGSAGSLAASSKRYLFLDEIDKYPVGGDEGDPCKLAEARTNTFPDTKKILRASTPTTELHGRIHKYFERTDRRYYWLPCARCGTYQTLRFDHIKWPEEAHGEPQWIADERLAWYECATCQGRMDDRDKAFVLKYGVWCPEEHHVDKDGKVSGEVRETSVMGYRLPSLYSPWLTFSDLATKFLTVHETEWEFRDFVNSYLCETYRGRKSDRMNDAAFTSATGEYKRVSINTGALQRLPEGVHWLEATSDVQDKHLYWRIRGWGYDKMSRLIDWGTVGDFERLKEATLERRFERHDGVELAVRMLGVDAGYRTGEVYEFARRTEHTRAMRGRTNEQVSVAPYSAHRIERHWKTGEALEHSYRYWQIDTVYFKDEIVAQVTKGQFGFPIDVTDEYKRQFLSEQKTTEMTKRGIQKEVWVPVSQGRANHYWDCEVYGVALAAMLGILLKRSPQSMKGATLERPARKKQVRVQKGRGLGGADWFKR